ncbi:MAG TPA: LuxR C-terminal-related transcriptional regulator [Prevotella sp.]
MNKTFFRQSFSPHGEVPSLLDRYKQIGAGYALTENSVAVLSNLRTNESYLFYGGFAATLGLDVSHATGRVPSIWEEEVLRLIHPEDLSTKYLQELRFFHKIKSLPKRVRYNHYLVSKLRMRNALGRYIPVVHRMFYFPDDAFESVWLSLCLYNPMVGSLPHVSMVVNSATGEVSELRQEHDVEILSAREKQILRLIDQGMMSKHIAQELSISTNTVNRHRQNILEKLQVGNSIEACRVAKEYRLL